MQDLTARDKANQQDPVVGETVYVNATGLRGTVLLVEKGKYSNSMVYTVLMENGDSTARLRREIVRVVQ